MMQLEEGRKVTPAWFCNEVVGDAHHKWTNHVLSITALLSPSPTPTNTHNQKEHGARHNLRLSMLGQDDPCAPARRVPGKAAPEPRVHGTKV